MSDGTTTQPDVKLGAAQSGTPKAISWEEHEKALRDATSAIKADVGRQRAESQRALEAAKAAQDRLDKLMKDHEQAELEAARDEPDKLTALRERQRRRQIESELEAAKSELHDKTTRLTTYETREAEAAREATAQAIATRLNVDVALLTKLSKRTDGSSEAIEEVAKELPRRDGRSGGLRPDSNSSVGGSASWEQIRAEYIKDPRNPAIKERYLQMRQQRGK